MNALVKIPVGRKEYKINAYYLLLIVVLAGAFIRFYGLGYASLWLDEIYSMIGSDPQKSWGEIYEYSKRDQPPLFFILLNLWLKVFGYSDVAGRAITCVYGVPGI